MITQEQLNVEVDLAKRIYLFYFEKMANFIAIGSDKYIQWYKDLCLLYFLCRGLISIKIKDGVLMIGSTEIDEDDVNSFTSKIREFLTHETREVVYAELDSNGNIKDYTRLQIPPTVVTYEGFNQNWKSAKIVIDTDDITEVIIPFDIANVDPDSIIVTVNDSNPIPTVTELEEGCHIIGTTLYWHTYFNLKQNDVLYIQYIEIA